MPVIQKARWIGYPAGQALLSAILADSVSGLEGRCHGPLARATPAPRQPVSASSLSRQTLKQFVQGDRQVAHALAGRVEHGAGDRGRRAGDAYLADAARAHEMPSRDG